MKQEDFEQIAAYLDNSLPEEERTRFEARMAQDSELAAAVDVYRSIEHTMRSEQKIGQEASLKQTLSALGALYFTTAPEKTREAGSHPQQAAGDPVSVKEERTEKAKEKKSGLLRGFPLWAKLAVAAGLLGIILLGVVWYRNGTAGSGAVGAAGENSVPPVPELAKGPVTDSANSGGLSSSAGENGENGAPAPSPLPANKGGRDSLFARYFHPDTTPVSRDTFLAEGLRLYEGGDYQNAITALEDIAAAPLTRGETAGETQTIFYARYYQAISYLATGNSTPAIAALNKLASTDPLQQAKRNWYLALAYLKKGQVKAALALLRSLSQNRSAGDLREKALALQKDLEKK